MARKHRRNRLWPLVAALWAAVGLSPCALAAVGNLDCLHCPTEDVASGHAAHGTGMHDMHQGHGDAMGSMHAAGHSSGAGDCGDDCRDTGDSLVDARGYKPTSKDAGDAAAIPVVPWDIVDRHVASRATGLDPPRQHPVPRQRPHAIFCVYLD